MENFLRARISWSSFARSCFMTKVNSLISTGRSSKRVFLLASDASLPNLAWMPLIPRPIAAACLANSERCPMEAFWGIPFAFAFSEGVRRDWRWWESFLLAWLRDACWRMERNSGVLSCMLVRAIVRVCLICCCLVSQAQGRY